MPFGKPLANQIPELQKLVIFRGLGEIGVGPAGHDRLAIFSSSGTGNHNDARFPAPIAPAQVLEDLDAMFLGQVDIQDHQYRTRGGSVLIRMIEEARGFFAILGDVNRGLDPRGLDRFPDQENIRRIIVNDQNMRITRRRLWIEGW